MEGKKIHIKIDAIGGCSVDVEGFKGESCKDATKLIEKTLAENPIETKSVIKDEWFQQEDHAGGLHIESSQQW